MKKHISVLMLVIIMMMAFVGCGGTKSDAPVVGDWKLTSVDAMGVSMTAEEFAEAAGGDVNMELSIKDNGSFTANLGEGLGGESGKGTWKYEEPTLTLSDSTDELTCEYKDGKLVMDLEQGGQTVSMTFEK